ncbi:MAG: hypothetical protein ACLGI3_19780, partial [Actinomycetes bacterium]
MRACDHAPDGATNNAWVYGETVAARFDHGNGCADAPGGEYGGLYVRETFNTAGNVPGGAAAYWTLIAPSGTTISAITYARHLRTYSDATWRAELRADDVVLEGCQVPPLDEWCHLGSTGGSSRTFSNLAANVLRVGARCAPSSPETTCTDGSTIHSVTAVVYGATVTINDPEAPTVGSLGGTLTDGGWLRGTRTATFSAGDETGIAQLELVRDGHAVRTDARTCDPTRPAPCANPGATTFAAWEPIDTATWVDGTYTLTGRARDAAVNPAAGAPVTVRVDNNAPLPPATLTADTGSGWSSQADRTLNWTIPDGEVAPVTAASVRLCRQGAGCTTSAAGSPTSTTVRLPDPG